jgi:hypothetical protein
LTGNDADASTCFLLDDSLDLVAGGTKAPNERLRL